MEARSVGRQRTRPPRTRAAVSASTEQTSASAQEIAALAQQLAVTAEELERFVGQFVLA